jgi:ATP-dependent Clp protease adaptor protein ClpS
MGIKIAKPELKTINKKRLFRPPLYGVIFHNDDYTPFDFVMSILIEVCGLSEEAAFAVTKKVHESGKGCGGVYTHDIAETKQNLILKAAEQDGHPLSVTVEPA